MMKWKLFVGGGVELWSVEIGLCWMWRSDVEWNF